MLDLLFLSYPEIAFVLLGKRFSICSKAQPCIPLPALLCLLLLSFVVVVNTGLDLQRLTVCAIGLNWQPGRKENPLRILSFHLYIRCQISSFMYFLNLVFLPFERRKWPC